MPLSCCVTLGKSLNLSVRQYHHQASLLMVENQQCGRPGFPPWVGKIPWRKAWQPTPVLLPGESHGQRSLVGHSPWGCKELGDNQAADTNIFVSKTGVCACVRTCLCAHARTQSLSCV